jgi:hypothetical protein
MTRLLLFGFLAYLAWVAYWIRPIRVWFDELDTPWGDA